MKKKTLLLFLTSIRQFDLGSNRSRNRGQYYSDFNNEWKA